MASRFFFVVIVGAFLHAPSLAGNGVDACDSSVLIETQEHLGNLSGDQFQEFFGAIDPSCKGDTRFMEWVNDLLFRTLESQPQHFINTFDTLPRVTKRMILDELSAPGHEGLDAAQIWTVARDANGPQESKQRILQALTKASCRCETEEL
jgi:hypothetical protein